MAKTPEELLGIKKPATEETLQSIDSTLKRIADILEKEYSISPLQRIRESSEAVLRQPVELHLQPIITQTLSEQTFEQKASLN